MRELPPPSHGSDAPAQRKFESEPPTKQKNVVASVYQSLLSVFDEMSAKQRMEFVDLASRYTALDPGARSDLLEIVASYAKLGASERAAVLELAQRLAARSST